MKGIVRLYLTLFNSCSALAWSYVLCILLLHVKSHQLKHFDELWMAVEFPLKVAQTAAVMEVVHAMTGIVRSPAVTTAIQVASRLQLVWLLWPLVPASHNIAALFTCLFAWSIAELIRYPFYALNLYEGMVPVALKWLRYSGFIVLYPIGIFSEVMCVWTALPLMKDDPRLTAFPYPMPNSINFELNLHKTYVLVLLSYIPGTIVLYHYMLAQRKRSFYGAEEGIKTTKTS